MKPEGLDHHPIHRVILVRQDHLDRRTILVHQDHLDRQDRLAILVQVNQINKKNQMNRKNMFQPQKTFNGGCCRYHNFIQLGNFYLGC